MNHKFSTYFLVFLFLLIAAMFGYAQISPSLNMNGQGRFWIKNYTYVNATNISGSISWSNLFNFTSACSSGLFISGLGSTLICKNASADINWSNLTNIPDIRYNNTPLPWGDISDIPYIFYPNTSINWSNITNVSIDWSTITNIPAIRYNNTLIQWENLTNFPANCSGDEVVFGLNSTSLICKNVTGVAATSVPWENLTNIPYIFYPNTSINWSNITNVSLNWTNLTSFPVSCPAGSYITKLDTSVTCTATTDIYNNVSIRGYNITNVSAIYIRNETNETAWRIYVNSTGSLIFESGF